MGFGRRLGVAVLPLAVGLAIAAANASGAAWTVDIAASSRGQASSGPAPATPTGATSACTSAISTTVKVSWNAVSTATSYTIWKSATSATSGYSVAATGVTGTSWTSGSLAVGTYWFQVSSAIGTNWTSGNSSATAQRTILVAACA